MLLELCDRILVIGGGSITGIVDGRHTTKGEIGLLMTKSKYSHPQDETADGNVVDAGSDTIDTTDKSDTVDTIDGAESDNTVDFTDAADTAADQKAADQKEEDR